MKIQDLLRSDNVEPHKLIVDLGETYIDPASFDSINTLSKLGDKKC